MTPDNETLKATPGQVKYLHVLYRALGWDEPMYREMLEYNFSVKSTSDLTIVQAIKFISLLQHISKTIDDRITDKQMYLVRKLWEAIDYSGGKEGDVHLNAYLRKYYNKQILAGLTKKEGIKLIKQIGQMTKQAEARKGKTTVLKKRIRCSICGALIMWVQLPDGRREAFDCVASPASTASRSADGVTSGKIEYLATDFHKCR